MPDDIFSCEGKKKKGRISINAGNILFNAIIKMQDIIREFIMFLAFWE